MSFNRSRRARALAAGTLSAALLSTGTAGALAANAKPSPTPSMTASPSTTASHKPVPMPTSTMASISLTAKPTSAKVGQTVVFRGRTKGLKVGSPLLLQHLKNGKWVALGATGKVKTGSSFAISTTFKTKGTETVRVASLSRAGKVGKVISNTVTVTVS
ncbi:hypothetical protein [Streptomyces camelliae]|uniref:Bacterial Ig domain-containing protein n=1 Tax=Streptomyces camelliae TaxID=3004093 RepID=A0ABY7P7C1_9ACTN|nr:hypothetical protein [Streptomyces sp. HUAS 2-6]WBO66470.1 hypothetical protein O1G22_28520 [Streptomyces sp. HUAS 2-6]